MTGSQGDRGRAGQAHRQQDGRHVTGDSRQVTTRSYNYYMSDSGTLSSLNEIKETPIIIIIINCNK